MTAERLAAIEAAVNSPDGPSIGDVRALLAEARRARTDADDQCTEADYWRESYRLAKGLTDAEINAMTAARDAAKAHPRPCRFPHEPCLCADELDGAEEHEECFGIHRSADGYRDCDGKPI
jgi:hypothetical protein